MLTDPDDDGRVAPGLALARGALLGLAVLVIGTVAHVSADGLLPAAPSLVILALLVVAPCVLVATGRRGPVGLVLSTVGGQAFVHAYLSLAAGHAVPGGASGRAAAEAVSPWRHLVDHLALEPGMALAHAVAAALVGWLLYGGERTLWALVDVLAALAVRWLGPLTALPVPAARPARRRLVTTTLAGSRRDLPGRGAVARRGPPLALATP